MMITTWVIRNIIKQTAYLLFKVVISLHAAHAVSGSLSPVVSVSQGELAGISEYGVSIFRGIPYAAPPTGNRRFQSPAPPVPWSGTRNVTEFAPECYQIRFDKLIPSFFGEEDCLYLNVYRPDSSEDTLPVLVWIHGGGRRNGNAHRDVSDFVRDTNTVVVTIDFRQAHMAFFAHPALSAEGNIRSGSGNYGFEDAISALRWVRQEIQNFGGDPSRVTIGGLSGGGTMVCGLLASPLAENLFHRAIVQSSGGCWFPTQSMNEQEKIGINISRKLLCEHQDNIPQCLRSRPAWAFYLAGGTTVPNTYPPWKAGFYSSAPINGGATGHTIDSFLFNQSWPTSFQTGNFNKVPVMIGITEHEGRRVYAELLMDIGGFELDESEYIEAIEGIVGDSDLAAQIGNDFPLNDDGRSVIEQYADIGTAVQYTCPHAELAWALSYETPTWLYEFRVPGVRQRAEIELGAYHGADTELLFGSDFWGAEVSPKTQDHRNAVRLLRNYIGNFVRTGQPNGNGSPHWHQHSSENGFQHLDFTGTPTNEKYLRKESCAYLRDKKWWRLPKVHQQP